MRKSGFSSAASCRSRDLDGSYDAGHAGIRAWVAGGGDLAAQFADAGLLDELMVSIAPVTLDAGRPLLPRRFFLELKDLARNSDFACVTYAVVGPSPAPPEGSGP